MPYSDTEVEAPLNVTPDRHQPRRPRRTFDDDDKGSVQNCFRCGFAYFSRWETHRAWSSKKLTPSPEDLVCGGCKSKDIFAQNMKLLKSQSR